jgi:hypothetical protein
MRVVADDDAADAAVERTMMVTRKRKQRESLGVMRR